MNTADLITSFFNNELSPDQERQFLLSVASSDSLRLGLKSHVMLDKILNEEAGKARVSQTIRLSVMKEAAAVAAAAGALGGEEALARESEEAEVPPPGFWSKIPGWASVPLALLLSVGSFFAGYYTGDEQEQGALNTPVTVPMEINSDFSTQTEQSPVDQVSGTSASNVGKSETLPDNTSNRQLSERPASRKTSTATPTVSSSRKGADPAGSRSGEIDKTTSISSGRPSTVGVIIQGEGEQSQQASDTNKQ